jgi:hypothetical protein
MNKTVLILIAIVAIFLIYKSTTGKTAATNGGSSSTSTSGGTSTKSTSGGSESGDGSIYAWGSSITPDIQGILTQSQQSDQVAAIIAAAQKENMANGMVVYDAAIKAGATPVNAAVAAANIAQNTAITQQMNLLAPGAQPSSYSLSDYFGIFNYEETQAIQNAESALKTG